MLNYSQEVTDIYVLIYIVLAVLIFNLISLYVILKKQKYVLSREKKYILHKKRYASKYVSKVESKLFNLGYPYKLTTKRYLFIKYILSIVFFIISYLNYNNLKIPVAVGVVIYFIPDYLIHSYIKKEKYILISEMRNIVNSIILCLSSYTTLKESFKLSVNSVKYKRFRHAYERFIKEYEMNGYKLKAPSEKLKKQFNTYELILFLSTLMQGEKEGNLLESLEKYRETLELNYFKYLKRRTAQNLLYVTFGTILSLINIVAIVMYPILVQVLNNLQLIFE